MQVKVYATLRDLLGAARLNVPVEGAATVAEVLEALVEAHPVLDGKLWDADRRLTGYVMVLLNGRSIEYLQGIGTPVKDSDVMALFPPVGGGSSRSRMRDRLPRGRKDPAVREITLRGIGVPVVGMYVEDLGGEPSDAPAGSAIYLGPGWRIELVAGEAVRVGSVQLGVTVVRIEAPEPIAEQIEALLSRKLLRAGG